MKVIKKFVYLIIISGIIGCSSGQGMEKAEENPEKKPEAIKYPITIINASTKNLRAIIRAQAMGMPLADFVLKPNGDKSITAAMDKGLYVYVTNGQGRSYKIYNKAESQTTFYLFIPPEDLQAWFSKRASRIGKHIDIYLRESGEENTIVALSDSENSKIFKKFTAEDPLVQALHIQPNSLEKQIFNFARVKKWNEINKLIASISDFEIIKNLIAFQLDVAALLANQMAFEGRESETTGLRLPESEALKKLAEESYLEKRKIKWVYTLLLEKKDLANVLSEKRLNPFLMEQIQDLLGILGDISKKFGPTNTLEEIKKALMMNFKGLFENLFLVISVQPNILPRLQEVKKELKIASSQMDYRSAQPSFLNQRAVAVA